MLNDRDSEKCETFNTAGGVGNFNNDVEREVRVVVVVVSIEYNEMALKVPSQWYGT